MVSADNLNFDVLELMFTYLNGHDLASIAQVSRSFLAGVLPRLYKVIIFRLKDAKQYQNVSLYLLALIRYLTHRHVQVMSPFAVILKHTNLAIHVRRVGASPSILFTTS